MEKVSKEYTALKALAVIKNPYDKVCPNRHLWEEGFISGAMYERQNTPIPELEKIKKQIAK